MTSRKRPTPSNANAEGGGENELRSTVHEPVGVGHNRPPAEIEIDLPLPTSTNRIWRRGHSRRTGRTWTYLSASYTKWKAKADEALAELRAAGPVQTISGPFEVRLVISKAKRHKLDLDNRLKAPLDWAQQAGLITDDKLQDRVTVAWGRAPKGARLTLTEVQIDP